MNLLERVNVVSAILTVEKRIPAEVHAELRVLFYWASIDDAHSA